MVLMIRTEPIVMETMDDPRYQTRNGWHILFGLTSFGIFVCLMVHIVALFAYPLDTLYSPSNVTAGSFSHFSTISAEHLNAEYKAIWVLYMLVPMVVALSCIFYALRFADSRSTLYCPCSAVMSVIVFALSLALFVIMLIQQSHANKSPAEGGAYNWANDPAWCCEYGSTTSSSPPVEGSCPILSSPCFPAPVVSEFTWNLQFSMILWTSLVLIVLSVVQGFVNWIMGDGYVDSVYRSLPRSKNIGGQFDDSESLSSVSAHKPTSVSKRSTYKTKGT